MRRFQKYSALVVLVFCVGAASATEESADSHLTAAHTLDNEEGNHTLEGSVQKLSDSISDTANITEDVDAAVVKKAVTAAAMEYKTVAAAAKHKASMEVLKHAKENADASRKKSEEVHSEVVEKQMEASKQVQEALRQEKIQEVKTTVTKSKKTSKVAQTKLTESSLDRQIESVEKELKDKEQDLNVQSKLAKEKAAATKDEMAEVGKLKNKTDAYKSEADVASKIAKEKFDLAAQAAKEEQAEETKFDNLDAERKETEKFLAQTQKESEALKKELQTMRDEKDRSQQQAEEMLKQKKQKEAEMRRKKAEELKRKAEAEEKKAKEEAEAADKEARDIDATSNQTQVVESKKSEDPPKKPTAVSNSTSPSAKAVSAVSNNTSPSAKAVKEPPTDSETVRRLMAENEKLKHANQVLTKQLVMKKVKNEKDLLKAKLKNKLVIIDRHHTRTTKKL